MTISDFAQLVIDWQELGTLTPHCYRYSRGDVELFSLEPLVTLDPDAQPGVGVDPLSLTP